MPWRTLCKGAPPFGLHPSAPKACGLLLLAFANCLARSSPSLNARKCNRLVVSSVGSPS